MTYLANIYIENVPKKTWLSKIFKPAAIKYKYTDALIEANGLQEAHIIVNKMIDEIKQRDLKFFSDKKFTPFVLPPKTIEELKK